MNKSTVVIALLRRHETSIDFRRFNQGLPAVLVLLHFVTSMMTCSMSLTVTVISSPSTPQYCALSSSGTSYVSARD